MVRTQSRCFVLGLWAIIRGLCPHLLRHMQQSSTDPPEGARQEPEGVWQVGVLVEMKPSFPPLRDRSLSVVVWPQGIEVRMGSVALCKAELFGTYDHVNDYIGNEGCGLKAADHTQCRYPSVLVAAVVNGAPHTLEDLQENCKADLDSLENLKVHMGVTRPVRPSLLLVASHFLAAYGFSPKEQVWFRAFVPLALERVILAPTLELPLSDEQVEEVVGQLYSRSELEHVVIQQGFEFSTRVMLQDPSRTKGRGQWAGAEAVPQAVTFQVLEAVPVLQGRITKETVMAVAPPSVIPERHASPTMGSDEEQYFDPEEERRPRSASASDFPHSDSSLMALRFVQQASCLEPQDYSVEAVAVEGFKLQSQCILLPEQEAKSHGIFHCQAVCVCASKESSQSQGSSAVPLKEVVLPLEGEEVEKRMHVALAYLYKDTAALERYVPTSSLGSRHEGASLQLAYIHPELLFFLYPETIAASRRLQLSIKILPSAPQGSLPTVTKLVVSQISMPGQKMVDATALQEFLKDKNLYLSMGDVFGIQTDTGKLYYKVELLEPRTEQNAALVDGTFQDGRIEQSRGYCPDVVPPSPLLPSPSYWSHTHPPGLEDYCDNLFANFIPLLRDSSCRPHRSPSVLVTGPPGVGKRTVVRAVARRCRLHSLEFNCFEFSSDSIAVSEKKLIADLVTAVKCAPAVVVLRQIHILGRKDNTREEPRLSSAFELFMEDVSNFNRTSEYPLIVVGMTPRPRDITPRVHGCFLHQLEVAPPTLSQREEMLAALIREIPSSAPDIDCKELAQRTAGFVLGDFTALLSQATQLAFTELSSRRELQKRSHGDLAISGVVVTQDHLETALDTLHSSHSDAIGAPKIPTVEWDDVGGLAEAKREILDTIQLPLLHPELFTSGLRRSGVLLYGAPGTGKTLLAKAVATECSLNFLSVKGPELINLYVGQSEENVREVFARARSAAPCVIFFDELDSIAPNRGRSGDSGGVMDRVVSQLLAELDGLQKSEDVFVIGATNRPDLVDPALLRPGRFDRLVYLGISEDVQSKVKILKAITRKFQLGEDVDVESLAQQCPVNLTGADLYALCSDAMLTALRRQVHQLEQRGTSDDQWTGRLVVEAADFQEALRHLTPSVSSEELQRYQSLRGTL